MSTLSDSKIYDSKISKEIDYDVTPTLLPKYRDTKIFPRGTGAELKISATNSSTLLFELPTNVYNLAKSYLTFDYSIAALAGNYTFLNTDVPPFIESVTASTRSSIPLCDLPNVGEYLKTVLPREIKRDDYLIRDDRQCFHPSNELVGMPLIGCTLADKVWALTTTNRSYVIQGDIKYDEKTGEIKSATANTVAELKGNTTPLGYQSSVNFLENKHWTASTLAGIHSGSAKVCFSDFRNTFLAVDKDILMPETLNLSIKMGLANKFAFTQAEAKGPVPTITVGDQVACAADTTFTNIQLHLMLEENKDIVNGISKNLDQEGGYTVNCNWVQPWSTPFSSATTNQPSTTTINALQGNCRLKKIYQTVFHTTGTSSTALDNTNSATLGTAKVASYYTTLNSQRLQEYDITVANDEDWLINSPTLRGKAVFNKKHFCYSWSHCDDWTKGEDDGNVDTGMPMKMSQYTYGFYATTASIASRHFTWAIIGRTLAITSRGVAFI